MGNMIKKIALSLYVFFIIYMPRISDLVVNVPIELFVGLLLCLMIPPWLFTCKKDVYGVKVSKNVFFLISGILVSSIYFAVRALLANNDLRILQNTFIIVQIFHILIVIDLMTSAGFNKDEMMRLLLGLGAAQGVMCVLMLIFPGFRKIALNLYYLDRQENVFITRMRIYGISGDYTYFTPIYHGMLATVALYYSVFKKKNYLLYIPFILISILLNGRFGLIVFMMGIALGLGHFLLRGKVSLRMLRFTIIMVALFSLGLLGLAEISPYTYEWILGGYRDTLNLVFDGNKTGNYSALLDRMLYIPRGWGLIFGEGHRVYSYHGLSRGYAASDIGYVNDLFMGGLIYVVILYGTVFRFLLKKKNAIGMSDEADYNVSRLLSVFLTCTLLLSNFKGEAMRGGTILFGAVFLKLIVMQRSNEQAITG